MEHRAALVDNRAHLGVAGRLRGRGPCGGDVDGDVGGAALRHALVEVPRTETYPTDARRACTQDLARWPG